MNSLTFQLTLIAAIACAALSLFSNPLFALGSIALLFLAFLSSRSFSKNEAQIARNQCVFALVLIAILFASNFFLSSVAREYSGIVLLVFLPILAVGVLAAKHFLSARFVEGTVLASDHGYAVIRVEQSMSHPFKGEYAVSMKNAKRGSRVRLHVKESLFSPPRLEHEGSTRN